MSEDQLTALLAKLKDDSVLLEKLKCAASLDAAVVIAQEAGFDVSKADWVMHQDQASQHLELMDQEMEGIAGGKSPCRLTCGDRGMEALGTCGEKG
jgi:predicted ribosomally synthesized peptide with nif11-like leader